MDENDWLRMGLPPLVLSKRDLGELLEAAGEGASLEVPDRGTQSMSEIADLLPAQLLGVKVRAPGMTLSLGANAHSTELAFADEPDETETAERVLKRLESCRRRSASLTHTDGAIFVGMLLPIAAGMLAPPSSVPLACGIAAGAWTLYLWWAQGNAHRNWCVFRQED